MIPEGLKFLMIGSPIFAASVVLVTLISGAMGLLIPFEWFEPLMLSSIILILITTVWLIKWQY